jgi:hypothetical protein
MATGSALLLAVGLNLAIALMLWRHIGRLSHDLRVPANGRSLEPAASECQEGAAQPEVQIASEGEPQVQFNQSGEARVQIRQLSANETREMAEQQASQMQGQAAAQGQQVAQPAAGSETRDDANTAVSAVSTRDMQSTVREFTGYAIVDSHAKKLGDIDKVVR